MYSLQQIWDNTSSGQKQVVDARSSGRFQGTEPEPRPGLPSGHIPGSQNVPFPSVLQDMTRWANAPAGYLSESGSSLSIGMRQHHAHIAAVQSGP